MLLIAAPHLSTIVSKRSSKFGLSMHREHDLPEALGVVNARLGAGLQVFAVKAEIMEISLPIHIALHYLSCYPSTSSHMSTFFSPNMPASCKFTRLRVCGRGQAVTPDVSQCPRMLPSLRDVSFSGMAIDASSLLVLADCPALSYVKFSFCKGVTFIGVAALCASSKSLRQVMCCYCRDINVRDKRVMQRKGWGGAVKVMVLSDGCS